MEVLLNSLWVLLALATILAWGRHARHAGAGHAHRFVALVCMLLLMFPVISATDDLHPAAQDIEDSSQRTQKAWTGIRSHVTYVPHSATPALPLISSRVSLVFALFDWLRPARVSIPHPGVVFSDQGRSPPSFLS